MTEYVKATSFASKDTLPLGNPLKIVNGTEIDTEFNNIATAVATKADLLSPVFTGTPTAPTAASGTSTTQLATTAFATASISPFTGAMLMWPTATAPTGFLLCNGAVVSRSTYAALFAILGVVFGSGDGSTTFTLPDYRNKTVLGAGDLYAAAGTGGSKDAITVSHTHTLTGTTDTQGAHVHDTNIFRYSDAAGTNPAAANAGSYSGKIFTAGNSGTYNTVATDSQGSHSHSVSGTTASAGSSGTNANLPPYLGVYFIIKT